LPRSNLPIVTGRRHERIGEAAITDGMLERLIPEAHTVNLPVKGYSPRDNMLA
jgi:hypothetical protein